MMSDNPDEEVVERVRRDFVAFADPRTLVEVVGRQVRWTQKRTKRELIVVPPYVRGIPDKVIYGGQQYDYRQFFASEHMANVLWLSEEVVRLIDDMPASTKDLFLPPYVRVEGDDAGSGALRTEDFEKCLIRICAPKADQARTDLIFLQGRAGDGKSTALVEVAKQQSKNYANGVSDWLFLYIDAQGRALARFDEAVALILDDLNATFRYQALSVLTRLGLIVPIIDGFDELLGSGGYEDAFSSLESFLVRLNGQGGVVTSARSTFYQFSALSRAASRLMVDQSSVDVQVHSIQLLPWDEEQSCKYLRARDVARKLCPEAENAADDNLLYLAAERRIGSGAEEILSTPFLLNRFVDFLEDGSSATGRSILVSAIRSLVRRELVEKILDPEKGQVLSEMQFEILFGAIAEEMWWQETRALDEETLLTVAELAFEHFGLSKGLSRFLLGKLTSNAVIKIGEGTRRFSFRHEIYFSYFLAKLFVGTTLGGNTREMATLFSRAIVPATLGRETAVTLEQSSVDDYLAKVSQLPTEGVSSDIVRMNKGYMVAGAIKEYGEHLSAHTLTNMHFDSCDFKDTSLGRIIFDGCRFERPDLRGCAWGQVNFQDSVLVLPLVSKETRLSGLGLVGGETLIGLRVWDEETGSDRATYKLSEVSALLDEIGLGDVVRTKEPQFTESQEVFIERLRNLLRVAARSIYFSDQDLQTHGYSIANMRDVLSAGSKFGLWVQSDKQRGGRRNLYKLCFLPEEILMGESGNYSDNAIRVFWDYVRANY